MVPYSKQLHISQFSSNKSSQGDASAQTQKIMSQKYQDLQQEDNSPFAISQKYKAIDNHISKLTLVSAPNSRTVSNVHSEQRKRNS